MRIDLKRDRTDLYAPGRTDFTEVVVPAMTYLAVDGHGDPNVAPEYTEAVEALYTAAYAVRAEAKRHGVEFVVGPLEGLWTSADPTAFVARTKGDWDWTMLIPIPGEVGEDHIRRGLVTAEANRPDRAVDRVRPRRLDEGRCLQIMHVGRYDDEGPTLARLHHEVMPRLGVTWNGPHHEIYLSDPRRTAPDRVRTVLRQPVRDR